MSGQDELRSNLGACRRAAGLSVSGLAERVGVSRQALGAVEAGRATPSTTLALRLARALGCPVEALFTLPADSLAGLRLPEQVGRRVALGRVAGRWVAHPLDPRGAEPADGLVTAGGIVEPLVDLDRLEQVVLVAGCAPVLGALAGRLDQGREGGARWIQSASGASLRALAEGRVHVAGLHLARADQPGEHARISREQLPGVSLEIVHLVGWREGLVVAPGNPLGIRGVEDLLRPGLRVGIRPAGSGAALVLEAALSASGPGRATLRGPMVGSHAEAATAVLHGAADVAVLVEPVAEAFGLPFLPLAEERFELVLRSEWLDHPGVRRLLDQLHSARFAREVGSMGAYDVRLMGAARRVEAA